ncbi:MAG: hypothetical protein AAF985_20795 [Bacteroidota bacterium]
MKLFKVLQKLDSRELTRFGQFLETPLFNRRADVKQLFELWLKGQKRQQGPPAFWAQLFPDRPFSAKDWNLLTSRLFKLLEEYLALNEIRKNEAQKKFYLAKAYRKIQQEQLFKAAIRDAGKAWEKQTLRNTDYLRGQHDLSFEQYEYIISINRKEKTNLQEVSDHLDAYILAAKLRQACYALSRESIKQEAYEIGLLNEVLHYIKAHPAYLDIPAIAIYYFCYQMLVSDDQAFFFRQLREAISNYQHYFPPSEMRDIYTFAINYSIRELNSGSTVFIREAFELYVLILEQGYLLEDGVMLESTFSNIVTLASKLDKYAWARQFIHDYKQHLKPAFRTPIFHFSLGKLFYEEGQLEESLKELVKVETKASFLLLAARTLQLKIYYELKEFDPLESLLESLRVYLQRSKNLAYRREHYHNILIFARQLLQMPIMGRAERKQLYDRIMHAEHFAEKEWFLKQLRLSKYDFQ